jgi:hypothetical protein
MELNLQTTVAHLKRIGLRFETNQLTSGGQLIILPTYGRILGLWSDPERSSHLWINPSLFATENTRIQTQNDEWTNPGGDRIWLSPEREFFFKDPARPTQTHIIQHSIDPGNYSFDSGEDCLSLENVGEAKAFASNMSIPFTLTRTFHALANSEVIGLFNCYGLKATGYEEETNLQLGKTTPMKVGVWNLLQVCRGGTAYIPVSYDAKFTRFYGEPDAAVNIDQESGICEVSFEGSTSFKIGFKATWISGKILYVHQLSEGFDSVLIRTFRLSCDDNYADIPLDRPSDNGYAAQLFYGGNRYDFGELEYHGPAVGGETNRTQCNIKSLLYAASGPREKISDLVKAVLHI